MASRRARRFVEALISGRRPDGFSADPEDAELVRTAIMLQSARRDLAEPREAFMSDLFDELAASQTRPVQALVPRSPRPKRAFAFAAAAALALIAGTFGVTEAVDQRNPGPAVAVGGVGSGVQGSALLDAQHRVVGEINLYRGNPSWIFMNIREPGFNGTVSCQLMSSTGGVLLTGTFQVTAGAGEFARSMSVNPAQVSSARIVNADGATLALAHFSPR
jgi:hypothetical protein